MTDRERFIKIVDDYTESLSVNDLHSLDFAERFADHLLANGVIAPPCKVGDVVYYPWIYDGQCGIAFTEIESIRIYVNGLPMAVVEDWKSDVPMPICFTTDDFGKTVFLTKEEAKAKLKEREKDV